ncbi:MAG: HlyD family efflux transporter periplasmic adaptor subunit [Bacteroidia bacterium]
MLNISPESIAHRIPRQRLTSLTKVLSIPMGRRLGYVSLGILILLIGCLLLPWTQTVDSQGAITTLAPDQRPQAIHNIIAGRIERWYVQEGDYVEKGDTILHISEVKDDYFDPRLLERTKEQITAKNFSVQGYESKTSALDQQIAAMVETRTIKLQQTENKIRQSRLKIASDSISFEAAKTNLDIAQKQYDRMVQLYNSGLKSLTDLEARQLKLQEAQAKAISDENKLLTSRNELLNALAEMGSVRNEYADKIAKAQSEKFEAVSAQYDAEANVMKLENQYSNYDQRQNLYYITSPQSGYIARVLRTGVGEVIKEGEELVSIMPHQADLAVELYVVPRDLPLVQIGSKVRLVFDGWPAIVFSGWPGASAGTYSGSIVAIDRFISPNGKFRVLVQPDKEDVEWPSALQFGGGVRGLFLLNDVPVGYEIWRRISGFPPKFYQNNTGLPKDESKKEK